MHPRVTMSLIACAFLLSSAKTGSTESGTSSPPDSSGLMVIQAGICGMLPRAYDTFDKRFGGLGIYTSDFGDVGLMGFTIAQRLYMPTVQTRLYPSILVSLNFKWMSQEFKDNGPLKENKKVNRALGRFAGSSATDVFLKTVDSYFELGPSFSLPRRMNRFRIDAPLMLGFRFTEFIFLEKSRISIEEVLAGNQVAIKITNRSFLLGVSPAFSYTAQKWPGFISLAATYEWPFAGPMRAPDGSEIDNSPQPVFSDLGFSLLFGFVLN